METSHSLEDKHLDSATGGSAVLQPPLRYRIQEDNCVGCCVCVDVCPAGAIREVNYAPVMNPSRCTGCRKCEAMCPMGAIEPMVYYPSI